MCCDDDCFLTETVWFQWKKSYSVVNVTLLKAASPAEFITETVHFLVTRNGVCLFSWPSFFHFFSFCRRQLSKDIKPKFSFFFRNQSSTINNCKKMWHETTLNIEGSFLSCLRRVVFFVWTAAMQVIATCHSQITTTPKLLLLLLDYFESTTRRLRAP